MVSRAFIASTSPLISRFIVQSCHLNEIEPVEMRNETEILDEIQLVRPRIVFLQANIIEQADVNLVARIKVNESLGDTFVVVTASRDDGVDFAYKVGADAFLPVPHTDPQIEAIWRQVFGLPKKVHIISRGSRNRLLIQKALSSDDYQLGFSDNGEEGIRNVLSDMPDLVISELILQDMRGSAVCERIKGSKFHQHIPVILTTEKDDEEEEERCFESGVQHILRSPLDSEENRQIIASLVSHRRKGKAHKALVVDDSPLVREVIAKMFKQLGFFVTTAENGREGLEIVKQEIPDIITTDYEMPVMKGDEFCIKLKEDKAVRRIPVIMVTSRDSAEDVKKGKSLGVSYYLTKPFDVSDLERRVTQAMVMAKNRDEGVIPKIPIEPVPPLQSIDHTPAGEAEVVSENKFVSILFIETNATILCECEKYSADKLVVFINSFFDRVTDVLKEYNAFIDTIIGESILARFNTGDRKADALNALQAALALFKIIEEFNLTLLDEVTIRIGITSGYVVLGHLGAKKSCLKYSMFGDHVKDAQRIARVAQPMECLISSSTCQLIENDVNLGDPIPWEQSNLYPLVGIKS